MTIQRWIVLAAVAFVALFMITSTLTVVLWSSGDDPPRQEWVGSPR